MQNTKFQRIAGAVILILIIVSYSFYRMHDADEVTVSAGVDDSKIGIAESGKNPVFINLDDVENVELTDDYDLAGGTDYEVYADEKISKYIVIRTEDKVYVVNTNNKKTTETVYKDIQNAIAE